MQTSAKSPEPQETLTAVFFLHLSTTVMPMMKAWLGAEHRISAVVIYGQRWPKFISTPIQWLAMQCIVMRMRRSRIRLIELESPLDWERLRLRLSKDKPDVAITYGFMRLLPRNLLSLFPSGALNFHPALLPNYRGPSPFHWLALDNAWQSSGGVTLHEMTDVFDEGPIVAQVAMSGTSGDDLRWFVSNALACMTRHVIPRYCAGELRPWPQPPGVYPYAGSILPKPIVELHWTSSQLRSLCQVFVRRPGVSILVSGKPVRLLAEVKELGPPSGKGPVMTRGTVEFDLSDRRVRYRRHRPLSKFLSRFAVLPRILWRRAEEVPIRFGPFDGPPTACTSRHSATG